MPSLFKKHPFAVVLSVLVHLIIVGFFVFGLDFSDKKTTSTPPVNTVKATVIDGDKIKVEADKLKKREQQKKLEESQRLKRLEKQRKAEQKKLEDVKKQQQDLKKKLVKQKADEAARLAKLKKQKADATKKKTLEAKKKAAAKKKADAKRKADAKKKKLTEDKRKRIAAEKKRKQKLAAKEQRAREQAAQDAMAREEQEMRAQAALTSYSGAIRQKVGRNWIEPAGGMDGLSCIVRVSLIPGGEVINAQVIRSSGDALFDRSVEIAALKASPLPIPDDPSLFSYFRTIEFIFDPEAN